MNDCGVRRFLSPKIKFKLPEMEVIYIEEQDPRSAPGNGRPPGCRPEIGPGADPAP